MWVVKLITLSEEACSKSEKQGYLGVTFGVGGLGLVFGFE